MENRNNQAAFDFLAASYAREAFLQAQFNNRVNAYIGRGFSSAEANRIVRTWYLAYRPVLLLTWAWVAGALGWLAVMIVMLHGDVSPTEALVDRSGRALDFFLRFGLPVLLGLRIKYCVDANKRTRQASKDARRWLIENNY